MNPRWGDLVAEGVGVVDECLVSRARPFWCLLPTAGLAKRRARLRPPWVVFQTAQAGRPCLGVIVGRNLEACCKRLLRPCPRAFGASLYLLTLAVSYSEAELGCCQPAYTVPIGYGQSLLSRNQGQCLGHYRDELPGYAVGVAITFSINDRASLRRCNNMEKKIRHVTN